MILKQWFETQGINVREYSQEVTYRTELVNGDRKIKLLKGENNDNTTYVLIEILEQNVPLAIYHTDYFDELEVKHIITEWVANVININELYTISKKIQISYLYNYYLKFGQRGFVISSWDIAKEHLKDYINSNTTIDLVYNLCAASTHCTQFYCLISSSRHIRFTSGKLDTTDNTSFSIEIIENGYEVSINYETKKQEFLAPQEAVAYLETLLIEHLQNT